MEYTIRTNSHWETTSFEIRNQQRNQDQLIEFCRDETGVWTSEGKPRSEFNGCVDIDISLTPFTNSLPINRLKLEVDQAREIQVIYLDMLAGQLKRVTQKYTRLSESEYLYENVPNDFEARIQVDEFGLVVDYPMLFVRTALEVT